MTELSSRRLVALVILPQLYNPDDEGRRRAVEPEKFDRTMQEIARRFGGGVLWWFAEGCPRGYWWHRGILYEDELAVIELDLPDETGSRDWLGRYARDILIPRFEQKAIYIKLVGPVEVIVVEVR